MSSAADAAAAGGYPSRNVQFVIFDENFLRHERMARDFLALNRAQLVEGRRWLPLLFADAASVVRYSPVELLEMGVDALWIGMETTGGKRYPKTDGVDVSALVARLQSHGVKVFISFIAGLDEQTPACIEQDMQYALSLGAAGYQYSIFCPMPGTASWRRLREAGRLVLDRPECINMDHFYIQHDQLTPEYVRLKTTEFQRLDYHRHGPLALRYVKLRLAGYRRHRDSSNPALRARAMGFRDDLMHAAPVLSVGRVFAPNERIRQEFVKTQRAVRRQIPLLPTFLGALRGGDTAVMLLRFVLSIHPLSEPFVRYWMAAHSLRWDGRSRQRCRTLLGLLRHARDCVREVRDGVMPWSQPSLVVTQYPSALSHEQTHTTRSAVQPAVGTDPPVCRAGWQEP